MDKISMDFETYHKNARRTVNFSNSENEQIVNAAMGLCGEAGEFSEIVKKWRFQDHDFDSEKAIKELGDVLWYLDLAASSLGISLGEVAQRNIDKLQARYPERFAGERSRERAAGDD
jgi:NTP pyrophosphatase (non-canonical NTP hydrolase)